MSDLGILPIRLMGRMVSQLSTESEVEEKLNNRFTDCQWEVETYEGKTVLVEVSTISVRPRVNLGSLPEPDFIWTTVSSNEPSQVDRIRSILFNEWMTEIRFNVVNGEPEDLRPAGLKLFYASFVSSSAVALDERKIVTRAVRISNEHEMYSNKLETQIAYDGSLPEYTESLEKVIDNISYMQDNMDEIAKNYMMNLYSPLKEDWLDEQMARDLISFLFGDNADFESIELAVKRLWDNPPSKNSE